VDIITGSADRYLQQTHSLTSFNKLLTLVFRHVLLEVRINITIDVRAARAADGTRLLHTHPTKWNAVHLENKFTSCNYFTAWKVQWSLYMQNNRVSTQFTDVNCNKDRVWVKASVMLKVKNTGGMTEEDLPWWHQGLEVLVCPEEEKLETISTQTAQTSAKRQHNRIAEWFLQCKLAMQLWSESTRYFFNPVNLDFWLRIPGSGQWSGSSPKFIPLVPGPCLTPPRNFVKIRSQLFQLSDGQTNRQTKVKT